MAQRRMLSRRVSLSRKLAKVSAEAALLYTWIIPYTDDYGNFDAEPEMVKAQVVPLRRDMDEERVGELLLELEAVGLIAIYTMEGTRYLHLNKFEEFQNQRADRKPKAEYPMPDNGIHMASQRDDNGKTAVSQRDDSGKILSKQIEIEKEIERERESNARAHARLDRAAAASKVNETHPYDPAVPKAIVNEVNRSWGPARLTPALLDRIHRELEAGFPEEWMVAAIREAGDHGAPKWTYLARIIENWRDNGGPRTREEAEAQARQAEEEARRKRIEEEARERERKRLLEEARAADPTWQEYDRAVQAINRRRAEALRRRLNQEITVEEFEAITAELNEEAQRLRPPPEPALEEVKL